MINYEMIDIMATLGILNQPLMIRLCIILFLVCLLLATTNCGKRTASDESVFYYYTTSRINEGVLSHYHICVKDSVIGGDKNKQIAFERYSPEGVKTVSTVFHVRQPKIFEKPVLKNLIEGKFVFSQTESIANLYGDKQNNYIDGFVDSFNINRIGNRTNILYFSGQDTLKREEYDLSGVMVYQRIRYEEINIVTVLDSVSTR